MTTDTERLNSFEIRLDGIDKRLEDMILALSTRITSVENRVNVQIQITVGMWLTTMMAILAAIVTIVLRT